MQLLKKLFTTKGGTIPICPSGHCGMSVPGARENTPKAPANNSPKINNAAFVFSSILQDRNISAVTINTNGERSLYCEIILPNEIICYLYNKSTKTLHTDNYNDKGIYGDTNFIVPFVLMAFVTDGFEETMKAFEKVVELYNEHKVVPSDIMAWACNAFYYDAKDYFEQETLISPFNNSQIIQVQQAMDTANANSIPYIPCDFKKASYTHKGKQNVPPQTGFIDKCKEGEFEIAWEWPLTQQTRIPSNDSLKTFISNLAHKKLTTIAYNRLSTVIERINSGYTGIEAIGNDYMNAILVGKPGTGKTTTAAAMAAALAMPIYTIPLSKYTEEDTFQGQTKISDGGFKFVPTLFLEAYKNGGLIVLEEFNLADPAVLQGAIGQAIEAPFLLMEDGLIEVHRHPLCIVLMTMNTSTQGSREPNEALTSRAPMVLTMDDPNENEFVEILKNKGNDEKNSKKVYNAYIKIADFLKNEAAGEDIVISLTLLHCIEALYLIKSGFSFKDAIKDTLIGALAIKDLELSKRVYSIVIETMPDN